ncbi:MAG: hypothetical protein R3C55_05845 [Parvularculaceae bacterium]
MPVIRARFTTFCPGTGVIGKEAYRAGSAAAMDGDKGLSLTAATPTGSSTF